MFTTNYHQQYEINLNQNQEEKLEIVKPNLEIGYDIPEEIVFKDGFYIFFSDKNGIQNKLVSGLIKLKTTPANYAKEHTDYYSPEKVGHIWEVKNSKLIKDMIQKVRDYQMVDVLKKSKHYVLPLKDSLIEIVSLGIRVCPTGDFQSPADLMRGKIRAINEQELNWRQFNGPKETYNNRLIRDAIDIKTSNFETCTTPLEEFIFNRDGITMYLDDKDEIRHKLVFRNCKKIELTTIDCANYLTNYYYGWDTYCHILKDDHSGIIRWLKDHTKDAFELEALKYASHFALPLQDNLIEIIAEDVSLYR